SARSQSVASSDDAARGAGRTLLGGGIEGSSLPCPAYLRSIAGVEEPLGTEDGCECAQVLEVVETVRACARSRLDHVHVAGRGAELGVLHHRIGALEGCENVYVVQIDAEEEARRGLPLRADAALEEPPVR